MARKAASFAALIQENLDTPVELQKGRLGQFDILVDGRNVLTRKGGLIAKLLGRRPPWPTEEEVMAAVRGAA